MQQEQALTNIQNCVKRCRRIARTSLIVVASFWFIFAIFSGAKELGGGTEGLINNLPNALPWLGLFVVALIAWRWELLGGILLIAGGIFLTIFLGVYEGNTAALIIIIPMVGLGFMFMFIWFRIWNAKKSIKSAE
jgi:hypothetical protein